MPLVQANGIEIHYEVQGEGDPVVLIVGLGGAGRGWGPQIDLFARGFRTIVPDHRGAGRSSRPGDGYTIDAHARDMAEMLRSIGSPPAHIVGSSTGGAIAQVMALDHPDVVRSITLVSSWTTADGFFRHQFEVRKASLLEQGPEAYSRLSALFLFSPAYFRDRYEQVAEWVAGSSAHTDPGIMARRIDMILAFDETARLPLISTPTHVVVGDADGCTPPYFSRQLADAIPGAELSVVEGGHLIYKERPEAFHDTVAGFLARH